MNIGFFRGGALSFVASITGLMIAALFCSWLVPPMTLLSIFAALFTAWGPLLDEVYNKGKL